MTPNYFRFVKQDSSGGDSYDGYTLRHDDTFEGRTDWKMGTLAAPVYSEGVEHDETYLLDTESGGTWWDETPNQD